MNKHNKKALGGEKNISLNDTMSVGDVRKYKPTDFAHDNTINRPD